MGGSEERENKYEKEGNRGKGWDGLKIIWGKIRGRWGRKWNLGEGEEYKRGCNKEREDREEKELKYECGKEWNYGKEFRGICR